MSDLFGKFDPHSGKGPSSKGASGDPFADLAEATRLTGLGRLEEATALIQRSLTGRGPVSGGQPGGEAGPNLRVRDMVDSVVRGIAPVLKGLGQPLRAPQADTPHPATGGAFLARSHSGSAGSRDYKLFVPTQPEASASLVVMLHGCTQNPDDFAAGTGMNALAERSGFYVAYPAQNRSAHPQKCWKWYDPADQSRESGEAAIVAGITREVVAAYGIDPARVYIAGMSAGGAAAMNIAHAYPDLYAAVGVHSGLAAGCARDLGSALLAMQGGAPGFGAGPSFGASVAPKRIPTIIFHGVEDGTVSVRNADQILAQAEASGLTAIAENVEATDARLRGHPYVRTRYADRTGRVVVEDWRIRGAGHAWSGGKPEGSYTDPEGPDASRAMLDFFGEHTLGQ
jgi:poly(hydroxyalkanoate) depolymerase family esterase